MAVDVQGAWPGLDDEALRRVAGTSAPPPTVLGAMGNPTWWNLFGEYVGACFEDHRIDLDLWYLHSFCAHYNENADLATVRQTYVDPEHAPKWPREIIENLELVSQGWAQEKAVLRQMLTYAQQSLIPTYDTFLEAMKSLRAIDLRPVRIVVENAVEKRTITNEVERMVAEQGIPEDVLTRLEGARKSSDGIAVGDVVYAGGEGQGGLWIYLQDRNEDYQRRNREVIKAAKNGSTLDYAQFGKTILIGRTNHDPLAYALTAWLGGQGKLRVTGASFGPLAQLGSVEITDLAADGETEVLIKELTAITDKKVKEMVGQPPSRSWTSRLPRGRPSVP